MNVWNKISNIGITESATPSEKRRIHLINQTILIATTLTFGFVPVMLFFDMPYYIPYQLVTGALCTFCFFLCFKKAADAAVILLVISIGLNVVYCNICFHDTGVQYFFFPLAVTPVATIRNMRIVSFLVAWCVADFFITAYLSTILPVKGIIPEPVLTAIYCVVMVSAFVALFMIILNLKNANDKYEENIISQKKIVEGQKKEVEEKQKEILDSIRYAKRIQTALMTNEKYINRNLNQLNKSRD